MTERGDREALREPRNSFQQTMRRLAEEAMSAIHHDIADHEPEYVHEVQQLEKRFARVLKGKLKPMRRALARGAGAVGGVDGRE